MAKNLIKDEPYKRFSTNRWGLAPGLTVTLHMSASKRKIPEVNALIDTGAEITRIYCRDIKIDLPSDVDYNSDTDEILVDVEIQGQVYKNVLCVYNDHPYAGTEQMLIGMNLLENWLGSLHGKDHLLSVIHL